MATNFFEEDVTNFDISNSSFCFTGTFVTGARVVVHASAMRKGATIKKV